MKVYYNGVMLSRVLTKKWDETVKYDETGVNVLGNTVRMSFEASILSDSDATKDSTSQWPTSIPASYGNSIHGIDSGHPFSGGTVTKTSAEKLKKILRELQIPRRVFRVYDDVTGNVIFEAYPEELLDSELLTAQQKLCIDVNNGPKPLNVNVVECIGGYYKIVFDIEVTKIRCMGGETEVDEKAEGVPTVISNRCWTDETIDDNFYTTRVFSGKLTISNNRVSAHAFRKMYYPPLEVGFRRESVRFSESNDGLSLSYVITDRQVRNAAPYPVTKFSGSLHYSIVNSAQETVTIQLTVVGSPFAPRAVLLGVARVTLAKKIKAICNIQQKTSTITDMKDTTENKYHEAVIVKFDISENLGDPPSFTLTVVMQLFVTTKSKEVESQSEGGNKTAVERVQESTMIDKLGSMDSMVDEISKCFPDVVADNYNVWKYNRTKSQNPSPYGYNVYYVSESDEKATKDDAEHSSFAFFKSAASVPCAIPDIETLFTPADGDAKDASEKSNSLNTLTAIEKVEYITLNEEETTGLTPSVKEYPYTIYKSHAIYSTDYNRFVVPKFWSNAFTHSEAGKADYNTLTKDEIILSESQIIEACQPVSKLHVAIEAERLNRLPELPDPEEILTIGAYSEKEGGVTSDSPEKVISKLCKDDSTTSYSSIERYSPGARTDEGRAFYCLKNSIQVAEPKISLNTDGVLYTVLASYEYVMTRPLRKGDEVRLLLNPIFLQSNCYYPHVKSADGKSSKSAKGLRVLYNGNALNHKQDDATSSSGTTSEQQTEQ